VGQRLDVGRQQRIGRQVPSIVIADNIQQRRESATGIVQIG
jgi:hypothetical protein